jgi:hypothetical protein
MMTDELIKSLKADVEALQVKVGALEALVSTSPALLRRYQQFLQELVLQKDEEDRNRPPKLTPKSTKPN